MEEITDVGVIRISVVTGKFTPVNGEDAVIKAENKDFIKAMNVDAIKGLLYLNPMIWDSKDSQGQGYKRETVEKAAHDFLKGKNISAYDENHDRIEKGGMYTVESHINEVEKAWQVVVDFHENKEMMQKAADGLIRGASIDGFGKVLKKADAGNWEKIKDYINKKLNKSKEKEKEGLEMDENKVAEMIAEGIQKGFAARDAAEELKKADAEKVKENAATVAELEKAKERIAELEKGTVKPGGDNDEGEKKDLKKAEKVDGHEW